MKRIIVILIAALFVATSAIYHSAQADVTVPTLSVQQKVKIFDLGFANTEDKVNTWLADTSQGEKNIIEMVVSRQNDSHGYLIFRYSITVEGSHVIKTDLFPGKG